MMLSGIFDFLTWQGRVRAEMEARLTGTGYESYCTSTVVDNLHRLYVGALVAGQALPQYDSAGRPLASASAFSLRLTTESGVAFAAVAAFVQSLFILAKYGSIPYEQFDPIGYKATEEVREETIPESSVSSAITGTVTTIRRALFFVPLLLIGGLVAVGFALDKFQKARG
jgi:hypothetical protein